MNRVIFFDSFILSLYKNQKGWIKWKQIPLFCAKNTDNQLTQDICYIAMILVMQKT